MKLVLSQFTTEEHPDSQTEAKIQSQYQPEGNPTSHYPSHIPKSLLEAHKLLADPKKEFSEEEAREVIMKALPDLLENSRKALTELMKDREAGSKDLEKLEQYSSSFKLLKKILDQARQEKILEEDKYQKILNELDFARV